jgi:hypothetical protein
MGGDRLICANKSSCYQEITITSSSEVLSHFSVNHLHQEYPDSWLQEGTGLGVGATAHVEEVHGADLWVPSCIRPSQMPSIPVHQDSLLDGREFRVRP